MENILMRFCRQTHNHTLHAVAAHLGITVSEYLHIETGQLLLSESQGRLLGELYKVKSDYFFEAAEQLDLLLAHQELIKIQKAKIEELQQVTAALKTAANNKA